MDLTKFIMDMFNKSINALNIPTYYGITYLTLFIGLVIIEIVIFTLIELFNRGGIQKGESIKKDLEKNGYYREIKPGATKWKKG